jgi:hypothetical protein
MTVQLIIQASSQSAIQFTHGREGFSRTLYKAFPDQVFLIRYRSRCDATKQEALDAVYLFVTSWPCLPQFLFSPLSSL